MPYLYLVGSMCCSGAMNILGSYYNRKNAGLKQVSNLYTLILACSALVSWGVMYLFDFSFDPAVLPYSVGFSVLYTTSILGMIRALRHGSAALTSFVTMLSLVAVAIWGLLFWGAPLSGYVIVGLVLIIAALALCFFKGKQKTDTKLSVKWFFYAALMLVGNSGCSIVQKYQQMAFHGGHRSMLMVFASLCTVLFCLLLCARDDKSDWRVAVRQAGYFPVASGLSNVLLNLLVMWMAATTLSPSVIYPGIAIGSITLVSLVSVVLFGERLLWRQWLGLAVGAIAMVFLNL